MDLFRCKEETFIVKKIAYRYFRVNETVSKPTRFRGLYIAREGQTRQIINENELLTALNANFSTTWDIKKQYFGSISLEQQVRLMSETDLVFGVHGAAFVNVMFLRPRSGLIEFFAPRFHKEYYRNMAMREGLVYLSFTRTTADPNQIVPKDRRNANIIVSVKDAIPAFEKVIENVKKIKYSSF